jgi:uncharacterized membrane protein
MAWLRNRLLAGVAIAAPIGLTIFIVWWFVTTVDRLVWGLIAQLYGPNAPFIGVPGVGLVIALGLLIALGALAANIAGQAIINLGERIVAKVPLVRTIYTALKQVFEKVFSDRHVAFRAVCLVEFPRQGIWSMGFVTGDARGEPGRAVGEGYVGVYIPHSPNPWTGWLIFAKEADIRVLDLKTEDAAKMMFSLGLFQPDANGIDPMVGAPTAQPDKRNRSQSS